MADLDEVSALLHIHEKAVAHGGALSNIAGAALTRLRQINAEHALFATEQTPTPVSEVDHTGNDDTDHEATYEEEHNPNG